MKKLNKGFTLIEILIVIGIIAILAAVVLIAINPARQFAQARNTQRESNINAILNAVGSKMADDKGLLKDCLSVIKNTQESIITSGATTSGQILLDCLVPTYIASIPVDPESTTVDSLYTIGATTTANRIQICAPRANESVLGTSNPGEICVVR